MELSTSVLVALVVFLSLGGGTIAKEKKDTQKLQIGIKKRVQDCKIRSTKGDSLHMHYTVSRTF